MTNVNVNHQTLERFTLDILQASGVDEAEARIIAKALVWANLIGRAPQGALRLGVYLKRFRLGLIQSPCRPEFTQTSESVCLLDGQDGFGHYLGHIGMLKAIELADRYGLGLVGVRNSNHFGAAAYYVQLAAEQSKLGLTTSNSFPRVAPYGGLTPALGTNPFAFGAPTRNGQAILVDFATSAMAGSSIRQAKAERKEIPPGVIIDAHGRDLTDPNLAAQDVILPFGGAKGFCLSLMVEILSGVITGAAISHQIASVYKNFENSSKNGHLFIAIDIAKLMPIETYFERMEMLIGYIKTAKTGEDVAEILLPGETRWRTHRRQLAEGITLDLETVETLTTLAQTLNVPAPW